MLPKRSGGDSLVLFEVGDDGDDPLSNVKGIDTVGDPAVVGVGPEAGVEIKVPHVAVKVGNGVLVNLGRRNDKYRVGKPHELRVQVGEEIPEEGMAHEPVFPDGEANMEAVDGPRVNHLQSRFDLEAEVQAKVPAPVDIGVAPIIVGCLSCHFQEAIATENRQHVEEELRENALLDEADRHSRLTDGEPDSGIIVWPALSGIQFVTRR